MKRIDLSRERIQLYIATLPKNPKHLTRGQIRQHIQELAITNPPKRPKNVVWS